MALKHRIVGFVAGVLIGPAVVWAGLETGSYISDLVVTNPLGSDLASTIDDHIRLLKSAIKATFPNINGAVSATDEELSLLAGKTGTVWTSANDGSGSGLDADTIDGANPVTVANPTATIGLSAVNGSAATAMRSDGAPALDQTITPTWTSVHTFTQSATVPNTYPIRISTAAASFWALVETGGAANNRRWDFGVASEQLRFRLTDDTSGATNWATVDRTGTTVDTVAFPTDNAANNFSVGTVPAATVNNARMKVGATSSGIAAAQFSNGGGAGPVIAVLNVDTSGDNGFLSFHTEAGATQRGSITYNRAGGLVAYNTTSDERLKKNFAPAPSAREIINCIPVESYDWKDSGNHVVHGLVAQRLNKCAPYAVTQGDVWQIDPSKLVPALIKYVQEQDARISKLEAQIQRMH